VSLENTKQRVWKPVVRAEFERMQVEPAKYLKNQIAAENHGEE
jgi:hypothetical protein